jgi:thiol:disulfide interchange protein DsbD
MQIDSLVPSPRSGFIRSGLILSCDLRAGLSRAGASVAEVLSTVLVRSRTAILSSCQRLPGALGRPLAFAVLAAAMPALQAADSGPLPASSARTEHVEASLVAHAPQGLKAGQPAWLGLRIRHQPGWHTYWINPGDSGLRTTLAWTLPAGAAAGEIQWPAPERIRVGPLVNYGYGDELLLPVPLTWPASLPAGSGAVAKVHAEWLVCKEICVPESADLALPLEPGAPITRHAREFDAALAAVPADQPVQTSVSLQGTTLFVTVAGLPAEEGKAPKAFLENEGVIDHAALLSTRWDNGKLVLGLPISPQRSESPSQLALVLKGADGSRPLRITADAQGVWPAKPGAPAATSPTAAPASADVVGAATKEDTPATPFLISLGLAFLGGLLLNLMPCVLPVLALKVMGLVQGQQNSQGRLAHGAAYGAGVILSFMALAGLLLALRAGGSQLGWGFQLQSPPFVAGLAILFTLIGLNLAGLFEFGNMLPSALANARSRNPLVDDALSGVLAVLVASPCTAPFMGAAIGATLTQPPAQTLAVFASLGAGMAAPLVLASVWPAAARLLPRPGAWMNSFRTLMAFPMFATVAWLMWVLGRQVGVDALAQWLGVLVAIACGAWLASAHKRRLQGRLAGLALSALALWWGWPSLNGQAQAQQETWQPWSEQAVAAAHAAGRPVFVDFTAAWCITCQYNKRTVLADPAVLKDLQERKVVLLRADWTARDERITAQLRQLGRNGVPVYVFHRPAQRPALLPEVLSADAIRAALSSP